MRGIISYITNKYSKANNKYMEFYDESDLSKHIAHPDANDLYGRAMSQHLPYSRFKCLDNKSQ